MVLLVQKAQNMGEIKGVQMNWLDFKRLLGCDEWWVQDTQQLAQAIMVVLASFGLIELAAWWFAY